MKLISRIFLASLCATIFFSSCQKQSAKQEVVTTDAVPDAVLQKIAALGFYTDQVKKVENGYLVEGDIILTEENLSRPATSPYLLIATEEQYRTTNLVTGLPRTITVSVTNLPTVYSNAANAMIARYNALPNSRIIFQRITSGIGDINIIGFDEPASGGFITLGSSGFPTAAGDPYNEVKMNTNVQAYGTNPNLDYVTSVLQHEVGHCIGFRHTDYSTRSSCGRRKQNEGSAGVGAILIPGTPSGFDAESFMLACSNGGNRTFNVNDKVAMDYLY